MIETSQPLLTALHLYDPKSDRFDDLFDSFLVQLTVFNHYEPFSLGCKFNIRACVQKTAINNSV